MNIRTIRNTSLITTLTLPAVLFWIAKSNADNVAAASTGALFIYFVLVLLLGVSLAVSCWCIYNKPFNVKNAINNVQGSGYTRNQTTGQEAVFAWEMEN